MKIHQINSGGSYIKSAVGQQRAESAASIHDHEQKSAIEKIANTPAYLIDIKTLYEGESTPEKMNRQVSLTEDISKDAVEQLRQKFFESADKLSASTTDQLLESNTMSLGYGADYAEGKLWIIREMMDGFKLDCNDTDWAKYFDVEKNIVAGGKDAFLDYNLMFAGMAAYANDKDTEIYLDKFVEEGLFTKSEYDKIKSFAAELQDKSGVFVSAEFQWDNATGNQIEYSYMGVLCSIGVDELSFMANHREADEVWTNLAQGAYKGKGELIKELRGGGHDDIAEEYIKTSKSTAENLSKGDYQHKDGALWDATVGYQYKNRPNKKIFKELKEKYFGNKDVKLTYGNDQLSKAYEQGEKERAILSTYPDLTLSDAEKSNTPMTPKDQIETLKNQIKELNKQIQEIKGTSLEEDTKNEMIKKFEQQIQTLQMQINDTLNNMADK